MNLQSAPTRYVFEPGPLAALPVVGTKELFPVHRIYCVGRNYAAHAVEMGHDPNKEAPFFFQKNPDNLVLTGEFPYPPMSSDVHHEIELVVALKSGGADITTCRGFQLASAHAGRNWNSQVSDKVRSPCFRYSRRSTGALPSGV